MRLFAPVIWKLTFVAIALSCAVGSALAVEKYWIAADAQAIIIGRFHERWTYPWFDGWRVSGVIEVNEVLFGSPARLINYRLVCRWRSCRTWPPPPMAEWFSAKRIWFLRSEDGKTWGPPGYGGIDPGFRSLDQRASFEDYIWHHKR